MKRRKTANKTRKMFDRKIFGGNGKLISQGTHGRIYVDENDENYVYKTFNKHSMAHCEQLRNEYDTHFDFHKIFDADTDADADYDFDIYIPKCSDFEEHADLCRYRMERIFGLSSESGVSELGPGPRKYFVLNMFDKGDSNFVHSNNHGIHAGTNTLSSIFDLNELSFMIGKLYSKIHFEMNYDGYDCELIYGNIAGKNRLCLIDFDKVAKIEWELGYALYRKVDESRTIVKRIDTLKQLTSMLYESLTSMSLVPWEEETLHRFFDGYKTYIHPDIPLQQQYYDKVYSRIMEQHDYLRTVE
jgi:hypothetical protein